MADDMTSPGGGRPAEPTGRRRAWLVYAGSVVIAAAVTVALTALLMNIGQHKEEGRHTCVELAGLDEDTIDPEVWGRNFPRQYDSYRRTVDTQRTKHGGSEAYDKLEADP